jgi:hypothetical protein
MEFPDPESGKTCAQLASEEADHVQEAPADKLKVNFVNVLEILTSPEGVIVVGQENSAPTVPGEATTRFAGFCVPLTNPFQARNLNPGLEEAESVRGVPAA